MPVLTRALQFFRRKQAEVPIINDGRGNRPSITIRYSSTLGPASWSSRDYHSFAAQYAKNSDVYACVSLIATTAKQVKWNTEPGSPSERSVDLLKKSGGPQFVEAWCSSMLIGGNGYIEIGRNQVGKGEPVSLYLLSPDRVTAQTGIDQSSTDRRLQVTVWKVRDGKGNLYPVPPADMLHSKLFSACDPIYGMAPLEAAMLDIDAQNESATLMKRLMQAGFAPGWIEAAPESDWTDTQVAQLREHVRRSREAGEALFLQNAKWNDMGGFKPNDTGVSQQQILTKRDIASVFHVPPQLIGDTASQTYSNYQESRKQLYSEAVMPLLQHFIQDWNRTIGAELKSELEPDKNAFDALVTTRAEAAERVVKLWSTGLVTQNEARESLAYDPVAGGDVFYAPANFLPLQGSEGEPAGEDGA